MTTPTFAPTLNMFPLGWNFKFFKFLCLPLALDSHYNLTKASSTQVTCFQISSTKSIVYHLYSQHPTNLWTWEICRLFCHNFLCMNCSPLLSNILISNWLWPSLSTCLFVCWSSEFQPQLPVNVCLQHYMAWLFYISQVFPKPAHKWTLKAFKLNVQVESQKLVSFSVAERKYITWIL